MPPYPIHHPILFYQLISTHSIHSFHLHHPNPSHCRLPGPLPQPTGETTPPLPPPPIMHTHCFLACVILVRLFNFYWDLQFFKVRQSTNYLFLYIPSQNISTRVWTLPGQGLSFNHPHGVNTKPGMYSKSLLKELVWNSLSWKKIFKILCI